MGFIPAANHHFQKKERAECLNSTGKKGPNGAAPSKIKWENDGGQLHSRTNSTVGTDDRKGIDYPPCVQCGQWHPGDNSVSPRRCFVCRGGGHRWRNCHYMRQGCHYYGERGHCKKKFPNRATG